MKTRLSNLFFFLGFVVLSLIGFCLCSYVISIIYKINIPSSLVGQFSSAYKLSTIIYGIFLTMVLLFPLLKLVKAKFKKEHMKYYLGYLLSFVYGFILILGYLYIIFQHIL